MKYDLKIITPIFLWNALIAAGVFLPVFLIAGELEVILRVGLPDGGFLYELGTAMYVYVGMVFQVIMASVVYTVMIIFLPFGWVKVRPRLLAFALSPLIPGIIIALNLSGTLFLLDFYYSSIVATVAFGGFAQSVRES